MDNEESNVWENTQGARIIIDCWADKNFSYALVLYPDNVLHLAWLNIHKE
jgi:hypothetical protein